MNMLSERLACRGLSLSIPDSNGAVVGSRDDVPPIGRVSNGPHRASVPLERSTDWSTSLSIPYSNGAVGGSRDDVPPIGRVSNGPYPVSVPLERIANWSTSL